MAVPEDKAELVGDDVSSLVSLGPLPGSDDAAVEVLEKYERLL
ncbi:MAG: hypothetical protein JWO31_1340 [Phycisphaerales bacterium]|nr:hypothetical protein [Phycisphaerales bacterium]